jgi:hypothetical protein
MHHPFNSPFLPPLLGDPASPFTPSSAFHSPIFRFPPVGMPPPPPQHFSSSPAVTSPFFNHHFAFPSSAPPPPSSSSLASPQDPNIGIAYTKSGDASRSHRHHSLSAPSSANCDVSEARRMFLARLHSTVLKLERREEEEEGGGPVQQQHQVAGQRGTGQLSGYQVN